MSRAFRLALACLITFSLMMLLIPSYSFAFDSYEQYLGMNPLEIFRQDNRVRQKFQAILNDNFETFLKNLTVSRPTKLMDDCLISTGTAAYFRDNNSAIFCIEMRSGRVYAAVFSKGAIVHFYGANALANLPEVVSEWALYHALRADPFYRARGGPKGPIYARKQW